jgi:hypothetical protein
LLEALLGLILFPKESFGLDVKTSDYYLNIGFSNSLERPFIYPDYPKFSLRSKYNLSGIFLTLFKLSINLECGYYFIFINSYNDS